MGRHLDIPAEMSSETYDNDHQFDDMEELRQQIAELEKLIGEDIVSDDTAETDGEKYQLVIEKANQAIAVIQDGRFRYFNRKALEITGYSAQELSDIYFETIIHPADRKHVVHRHQKRLDGQDVANTYTSRILDREQNVMWVEIYAVLIEWDSRPAVLSFIRDITRIRESEADLREREDRYRTLFEHANDAIFFITEREEIIDVNHRACEMFGYSREELLNMKISQLQPGTDPELQIYANPYLSLDAPIEMTGLRKDGTLSAIEITITPLISGRQTLLMSIMRDITERKKAEEASRKFEFIANASKDLMTLVDRDYVYEAVNKAYCEAYQKPQEQLLGKTVEAVWGMETFYSKIKNNMDLALSGSEVSYEAWFEFHGRGKGFYKVIFYPYFNEKNEVTHTVVVSHDITKRKMAEQELVRLNKELNERVNQRTAELLEANRALKESLDKLQRTQNQLVQSEKMASLGSLVAGVSHEINTPIGIGVTGASLLDERTREIEDMFSTGILKRSDLEKYIQTAGETSASILSNLRRASELIQGFKQVAVDQSTEEKRMFKLREYIDEVLLSLRPRYKRTNHTISVQCSDDLELNSFPGAFMQIITNLVMNSLIHGFEKTDHGHITIDVEPVDTLIVFRYADNGKGIEQDIVKKIFDPFFTTKRGQGGTGLGLHIVYNLVTQTLNGEIECESTPGEKTEFTIRIPTACKPPEEKNNTSITDIRLSLK